MLRIGVTGHRTFEGAERVGREIDRALDRVLDGLAGGSDGVEIWSSLAEGADRLVAERAMARGARLVVVLPLPADDYRTDFGTEASKVEFDRWCSLADTVTVLGDTTSGDTTSGDTTSGDRTAAYLAAGAAIVERVDVLVALWDGQPARGRGGTAEVVELAGRRGVPVEVVTVERPEVTG